MNQKFISENKLVIRKVLNSEDSLDITKNFIESILNISIKKIILNPNLLKIKENLSIEQNLEIIEVRIVTDKDEEINVGIQFVDEQNIKTQLLTYYMKIHANQLKYNENRKLARTLTINILDFIYFASLKYDKKIKIDCKDKNINLEEMEFYIIELPKFKNITEEKMNLKEEWIIYLKGSNKKKIENIKNDKIKKLDKLLDDYINNK